MIIIRNIICLAGIVCVSPILIIASVCIVIEDGYPIFFKQEREIWHINQDPITMLKTKRLTGFKEPFKAKFTLFPQGYRGLAESYELEMPVEFIPF